METGQSYFYLLLIVNIGICFAGNAPNPNAKYYCNYPEAPFGSPQNISTRAESAEYIIYAKALKKYNNQYSLFGETYDVEWSLECQPMKQPARSLFPQLINMTTLGRFGPDEVYCGPRNVVTGFNYVFFAKNVDRATGYIELDEINNQEGLFNLENDYEARYQLAPWLYECVANHCHEDTEDPSDDWEPMTLNDRIDAAEYAFEVHMKDEKTGCIQCVLNEPQVDNPLERLYPVNTSFVIDEASKSCHDYSEITPGRYIVLLQREDINSNILPMGKLVPDEVNGQAAIIPFDNKVESELSDRLRECPAEDYPCPEEKDPDTPDDPDQPDAATSPHVFIATTLGLVFLTL